MTATHRQPSRVPGLAFALACLLIGALALAPAAALAGPINARSVILFDLDRGKTLYEQNADRSVPPASLTKILSMYVALDAVKAGKVSLKDQVRVSKRAANTGGSRMGLRAGDRVPLEKLLMGMAVSSGNDASCAVAEHIAGSEAAFIRLMNAKITKLGLSRSAFKTTHGLPAKGQTTTARDMLTISRRYLADHPTALRYHSTRSIRHNGMVTTNKNPLLGQYKGADGLKTGWTNASGYNIVTTAKRGNVRLMAVVLGATNSQVRAQEISRLMDAGFAVRTGKAASVSAALGVTPTRTVAGK